MTEQQGGNWEGIQSIFESWKSKIVCMWSMSAVTFQKERKNLPSFGDCGNTYSMHLINVNSLFVPISGCLSSGSSSGCQASSQKGKGSQNKSSLRMPFPSLKGGVTHEYTQKVLNKCLLNE